MTRWAILTGEYPPQPGGVSDYTWLVASGLAAAGDTVTVYAPPALEPTPSDPGVTVHRLPDHFGPRGLWAIDHAISTLPRPDRLLVQYVPHAFGWRAMNVPFVAWVVARAQRIAPVWVMFHEVMAPLTCGQSFRHHLLGQITRMMARRLAFAADRAFVSIPSWDRLLHRIAPTAQRAEWLPVPCVVPTDADPQRSEAVRLAYAPGSRAQLVGHFGIFNQGVADLLAPAALDLLGRVPDVYMLLIGRGWTGFRDRFVAAHPHLAGRMAATGELAHDAVPSNLRACDLLLQPYGDGVSSRRTSAMAGLANGVPVVTNRGFLSEPVWASGLGVVLVDEPTPAALSSRVEAVLRLPPTARIELANRAVDLYHTTFALEHTIARLQGTPPPQRNGRL